MPLTADEQVYVKAAKELAEIAKPFGHHMVKSIEGKNLESFRLNAYFFYRHIVRAELLCDLVKGKADWNKCMIPIQDVEKEVFQKLREALSK